MIPLFAFPPAIRKMIYTTNGEPQPFVAQGDQALRGSFPTDDAALKLLYLAIQNAGLRWRRPVEWTAAMNQFAILFMTASLSQRAETTINYPAARLNRR